MCTLQPNYLSASTRSSSRTVNLVNYFPAANQVTFALRCDDFYGFSCGTFLKNTHTADEKLAVNTESILSDKLDENLFRIFDKPVEDSEPRPHKIAKQFYKNCMNTGE